MPFCWSNVLLSIQDDVVPATDRIGCIKSFYSDFLCFKSTAKNKSCRSDAFTCKNKQCIHNEWKCDGQKDCHDGSDEEPFLCCKCLGLLFFLLFYDLRSLEVGRT